MGIHSSILVRQLVSLLVRPGACLDSDEWVSTPPSWSDPCTGLVGPGGISGLRQVGVHSSILVRQLAPLLVRPGACLASDKGVSTPPSWSDPCPGLVRPGGISGLRQVGVHSSILVRWLAPLLVRPGACLDSDEWVSTPPSWSDPCTGLVRPGGMSGLRQVGVHSSILVQWLAPLLIGPEACLDLDEWVSTPPSWSDPCPGLVGPGGISGLRQVGVHSSILVRRLASLLVRPGACLDLDEWVSSPLSRSDPCPGLVRPGGISELRQVGVHSSILVRWLAPLLVGPEACPDSDKWVSTHPSWSDPCTGLVGPGGISGLRKVGVHSSILVRQLAPLLVRPGACLDSDEWVSTPPSWSDPCTGLVVPGGISGLRQVGVHSSILVKHLASLLVGPGACLHSDEWASTPPSWSNPYIRLVRPGGISELRQVGVHSSILVQWLAPLLVGPGACLHSDEWVSTPPSWSDPCTGLVRPGGIFGLSQVGVHSSILVQSLAPLPVRPGACLDSDEWVSTPPSWSDPCTGLVRPGASLDSDECVHSSILVQWLAPLLVRPEACLHSDEWVSTPPSWSDPFIGLVGPGGIFGLR